MKEISREVENAIKEAIRLEINGHSLGVLAPQLRISDGRQVVIHY